MMMESTADGNSKCPTLPKKFNSKTSKQSLATIAFNDDSWGHTSRLFTASAIKKAQLTFKFKIIERMVKEFSKGNTCTLESLTTEAPEDPFNDTDEQANLADNDSNND